MKRYKHSLRVNIETENGVIQKRVYGNTIEECVKKKNELMEKNAAYMLECSHPTFSKVAESWRKESEDRISAYTYSCYKKPYEELIEEFGSKKISDIKTGDLQRFINQMHKSGFAHHTISLRKIVASQVFLHAMQNNLIEYNPATAVRIPRGAPKSHYELPSESDLKIVKNSIDAPFGLFYYFLMYTGLRREEALAIEWGDIDFGNKSIKVNKALRFIDGQAVISNITKTDDSNRTVPLLEPLERVLAPLQREKGLLFTYNGNPLNSSRYTTLTRKYKQITGANVTPHMLRVAYATILYDAQLDDKDAKELMGHSKIELTKNIYMRISQSRQKRNFEQLNNFVKDAF